MFRMIQESFERFALLIAYLSKKPADEHSPQRVLFAGLRRQALVRLQCPYHVYMELLVMLPQLQNRPLISHTTLEYLKAQMCQVIFFHVHVVIIHSTINSKKTFKKHKTIQNKINKPHVSEGQQNLRRPCDFPTAAGPNISQQNQPICSSPHPNSLPTPNSQAHSPTGTWKGRAWDFTFPKNILEILNQWKSPLANDHIKMENYQF